MSVDTLRLMIPSSNSLIFSDLFDSYHETNKKDASFLNVKVSDISFCDLFCFAPERFFAHRY